MEISTLCFKCIKLCAVNYKCVYGEKTKEEKMPMPFFDDSSRRSHLEKQSVALKDLETFDGVCFKKTCIMRVVCTFFIIQTSDRT